MKRKIFSARKVFNVRFALVLALILGLGIAIHTATPVQAATITTGGSGNWGSTTNNAPWPGGVIPGATDNVVIAAGHTVTIPGGYTATCGDLNVTGTLRLAYATSAGTLHVFGGGTSPVTTGKISGVGTIDGPSSDGTDVVFYGDWSFSGSLTDRVSFYFYGSQDQNTAGATVVFPRNLFIQKSGGTVYFPVTPTWGNYFHITGTGIVCYNGGAQSVAVPASGYYYDNLTLAGSGSKTISSSITVNGVLSMEGTATASAAPTYGSAATLQYKGSGAQTTGSEFPSTFGGSGGVIIANTSGNPVTLGGNKVVSGPLTINSGATLSTGASNYALTVNGDWTNSGTFTPGSGTVTLSGSSLQTMTGATTFYNLILNNSNGLTINNDETVSNTLTLTNGKVTTGSNKVIIPSGGSVSRTNGYVIGNLQKSVPTAGGVSRTFEIGTASGYNPVTVNFDSVSFGNIVANATAGEHPNIGTSTIDPSKDVNVYWSFTNSGITFTSYNATFNFNAGDIDGSANTTNFIVGKYSGGWTYPTVGTKTSTSTQATGMTSFSDFAVGAVNNPPTSANNTVTTPKNTPYVFSTSDFPFTDADPGDTLQKVQITTLETVGALKYGSADVTLNQEITAADIAAGNLTFVPGACDTGSPYTTFGFKVSDGRDYSSSAYTMTINVITQAAFRSAGNSTGANSATCVITKPTGLTVGDLMIAQVVGTDSRFSGNIGTFTAPAGWTGIRQDTAVYGAYEFLASALFWKTANATDVAASNFTFTATGATSSRGAITAWYGQNSTSPINAQNGQPNTSSSTTVTAPTITPSVANCRILLFCGVYAANTQSGYAITTSNPPSWAEAYDLPYGGTQPLGLSVGYATRSQTTATGSGTATTSSSTYSTGQLVAIAPSQQARSEATAANNGPVCEGGTLTLTGGPVGMTTYSWTGPNGYSNTTQSPTVSTNATLAMAGTYTLTVTDSGGCSDQATTTVTVNAKPVATASNSGPVCEGGTITLTGGPSGAYTYSWTGPNSFNSTSQSPTVSTNATTAMAGTYSLTVTNSTTGCTGSNSTSVVVNAKPAATASSNSPVCEGSTITLTGGPGGMSSYNWTGPNGFSSSSQSPTVTTNATLAMAGTYTLIVTNSNGCTGTNSTSVFVQSCTPYYKDADDDNYGVTGDTRCLCAPEGEYTATVDGDCDDTNAAVNPAATEVCNGIDDDCDTLIDEGVGSLWYQDSDGDGYGNPAVSQEACTQPSGYVLDNTDCNDSDAKEHPGQTWYKDADSDLYSDGTNTTACARPGGYKVASELTAISGDCNDGNAAVNPGATEVCNGIDDDCDGVTDESCTYTISGYIRVGGIPLAGVLVTAHSPWTGTAITDADGKYELTGVPSGETIITLTPTLGGYTFDPPIITITGPLTGPVEDMDFAAMAVICDYDGIAPATYAKIPFAIVQSGFHLVGQILDAVGGSLGLPAWITPALMDIMGSWVGGPLSWSVDMMGWGLSVVGSLLDALADPLGLPEWLAPTVNTIACQLFTPFSCSVTGVAFSPCG